MRAGQQSVVVGQSVTTRGDTSRSGDDDDDDDDDAAAVEPAAAAAASPSSYAVSPTHSCPQTRQSPAAQRSPRHRVMDRR